MKEKSMAVRVRRNGIQLSKAAFKRRKSRVGRGRDADRSAEEEMPHLVGFMVGAELFHFHGWFRECNTDPNSHRRCRSSWLLVCAV